MLSPVVWNFLAILVRLSPRATLYRTNVGWGVGVGRPNDGVGVGPSGVGSRVGVAVGEGPPWPIWFAGSGTHPATITAASRAAVMRDVATLMWTAPMGDR